MPSLDNNNVLNPHLNAYLMEKVQEAISKMKEAIVSDMTLIMGDEDEARELVDAYVRTPEQAKDESLEGEAHVEE